MYIKKKEGEQPMYIKKKKENSLYTVYINKEGEQPIYI